MHSFKQFKQQQWKMLCGSISISTKDIRQVIYNRIILKIILWFRFFMYTVFNCFLHREHIKEVVKLLGRLNALDHVITVASEHGIKDIKTLLECKWGRTTLRSPSSEWVMTGSQGAMCINCWYCTFLRFKNSFFDVFNFLRCYLLLWCSGGYMIIYMRMLEFTVCEGWL